jgi:hypothetical protein
MLIHLLVMWVSSSQVMGKSGEFDHDRKDG